MIDSSVFFVTGVAIERHSPLCPSIVTPYTISSQFPVLYNLTSMLIATKLQLLFSQRGHYGFRELLEEPFVPLKVLHDPFETLYSSRDKVRMSTE